jgi:nucleotide-binding universal stress UspA family protein
MNSEAAAPKKKDHHLLLAVDESESSSRAVYYVADFLGGFPGFRVTLLSVIPEPEEDFFDTDQEMDEWTKEKTDAANKLLEGYQRILVLAGFPEMKVNYNACLGQSKSLSDAILAIRCERCTVVVGRSHKSKAEEFLFGSTSSRLVHQAKNRAVWVVE